MKSDLNELAGGCLGILLVPIAGLGTVLYIRLNGLFTSMGGWRYLVPPLVIVVLLIALSCTVQYVLGDRLVPGFLIGFGLFLLLWFPFTCMINFSAGR